MKNFVFNFAEFVLKIKFISFAVFLHKSDIWENFVLEIWAKMFSVNQVAGFFNQPYPEQISEIAWFFACWYKFTWIKNWSKKFCGHSGSGTVKLNVSQEWIEFLHAVRNWEKLNVIWMSIVKHRHGHFSTWDPKICWLWWSSFWLDQHHILYLCFLNVSLQQLHLLDP